MQHIHNQHQDKHFKGDIEKQNSTATLTNPNPKTNKHTYIQLHEFKPVNPYMKKNIMQTLCNTIKPNTTHQVSKGKLKQQIKRNFDKPKPKRQTNIQTYPNN